MSDAAFDRAMEAEWNRLHAALRADRDRRRRPSAARGLLAIMRMFGRRRAAS